MIYYHDKELLIRDMVQSDAQIIPDGTGVWYRNSVCPQYAKCCNDDDLVLYLSKKF